MDKWCVARVEHAAVLHSSTALRQPAIHDCCRASACRRAVVVPGGGLIRAWLAIGRRRRWQVNPLLSPHALYCNSFVRHCLREAGYDLFAADVALSNTRPKLSPAPASSPAL